MQEGRPDRAQSSTDNADLIPLIAAIVEGDEAALSRLYELTAARLYNLAQFMSGNEDDAEEIVCDVYVQVWRRAAQFDPERGSVIAWLVVNCRSLALDLLRRRRTRQAQQKVFALQETETAIDDITADNLVNLLQEGTRVRRALSELSEVQRRLIGLAFFQDMSHSEIATAVQLPLGTVKSHINRGLRKLRESVVI